MEENNTFLKSKAKKYNILLDTSTIIYFEMIWKRSRASIFEALIEMPDVNFFVCNEVLSELISGKKGFSPNQLGVFVEHTLNVESSMDHDKKENRFLVEEDGEVKYIELNNISSTDWAEILLCQNHPELILIANDRKLIKSGAQVIRGRRVLGIPALLNKLIELYPDNKRLKEIRKTADTLFDKKHAFGNSKGYSAK